MRNSKFLELIVIFLVTFACQVKENPKQVSEQQEEPELMNLKTDTLPDWSQDEPFFDKIRPVYYETDVEALIQINNENDIIERRKQLINFIWEKEGFPDKDLPVIEKNIKDQRYDSLFHQNLEKIDKLVISMDYGLKSIAYHFIPKQSKNKLMIYQQGHRGDFIIGIETINFFLNNGYSVVAFSMPLLGMNNQPLVDLPGFGKIKLTTHEELKFLPDGAIKYFIEPVIASINYANRFNYDAVHMIGISGGGWTTTLCAAIDTRIQHSYPVAGSLPIFLRSECSRDWGDYEQSLPELYRIANYPELYMMGSNGAGRKQFQILNQYDACCFGGVKYRSYEHILKSRIKKVGNSDYDIYLDSSHKEHKISEQALNVVMDDLN